MFQAGKNWQIVQRGFYFVYIFLLLFYGLIFPIFNDIHVCPSLLDTGGRRTVLLMRK